MTALIKPWANFTISNRIPTIMMSSVLLLAPMLTGLLWVDYGSDRGSIFYNFRNNDILQIYLRYNFQIWFFWGNDVNRSKKSGCNYHHGSVKKALLNTALLVWVQSRDCNSEKFWLDKRCYHSSKLAWEICFDR